MDNTYSYLHTSHQLDRLNFIMSTSPFTLSHDSEVDNRLASLNLNTITSLYAYVRCMYVKDRACHLYNHTTVRIPTETSGLTRIVILAIKHAENQNYKYLFETT